jgi:transposase-like protein
MRKKHSYEDRLKYMKMLEAGYSMNYIHEQYGIGDGLLKSLWIKYQQEGPSALVKKTYIRADGAFKERIVRDIEENFITLHEASVKYDVWFRRSCI